MSSRSASSWLAAAHILANQPIERMALDSSNQWPENDETARIETRRSANQPMASAKLERVWRQVAPEVNNCAICESWHCKTGEAWRADMRRERG